MEYKLLDEIVEGCKITNKDPVKCAEVFSKRHEEYIWLIKRDQADTIKPIEYAISFLRDYIWFGDENYENT